MVRVTAADVASTAERLHAARDSDPERFAALDVVLEPGPPDGYDPDQTPAEREAQ